jgi:Thioesterase-like superfamily
VADALFTPDAGKFLPSEHTRGPWDPAAMHGGAPAALIGGVMEALPAETRMAVVRTTVEIFRPVPLRPLTVTARIERNGRRVQLLSANLMDDETEVCRATAWRMRVTDLDLGPSEPSLPPFAGPAESTPHMPDSGEPAFHRTGIEMRYAAGAFFEPGAATAWLRLTMPVVAGETPTPLQRALAAADFGNGISAVLSWDEFLFINTDLTVYLHRAPEGEWVCLDASTDVDRRGIGLAHSRLYDERGPVGRSLQGLYIDRRGQRYGS